MITEEKDLILQFFAEQFEAEELMEGVANPAMLQDSDLMRLERELISGKGDRSKLTNKVLDFVKKYEPLLAKVKARYESLVRSSMGKKFPESSTVSVTTKDGKPGVAVKGKFIADIKSASSIVDKAVVRKKGFVHLNDLVRGAVLFDTKEQADAFVHRFLHKNKQSITDYEEKKAGQDALFGYYGSHHLAMNVLGLNVEMQVMTKKLWTYKDEAHKIYVAARSKDPSSLARRDQADSQRLFFKGNQSKRKPSRKFEGRMCAAAMISEVRAGSMPEDVVLSENWDDDRS